MRWAARSVLRYFVRDDVMELTKKQQTPYTYGSITGRQDFYFSR